jgi:hypothetical protein
MGKKNWRKERRYRYERIKKRNDTEGLKHKRNHSPLIFSKIFNLM